MTKFRTLSWRSIENNLVSENSTMVVSILSNISFIFSAQIKSDAGLIFDEVVEEYCELPQILQRFDEWKKKDLNAYKEAYVHLCLPKIASIFIRAQMVLWSPFEPDFYEDIDKMKWFHPLAMYGRSDDETEDSLRNDPDVFLIPTIIEKIILPKLSSKQRKISCLIDFLTLIYF